MSLTETKRNILILQIALQSDPFRRIQNDRSAFRRRPPDSAIIVTDGRDGIRPFDGRTEERSRRIRDTTETTLI